MGKVEFEVDAEARRKGGGWVREGGGGGNVGELQLVI